MPNNSRRAHERPDEAIYHAAEPRAAGVRVVLQMLIGVSLVVLIVASAILAIYNVIYAPKQADTDWLARLNTILSADIKSPKDYFDVARRDLLSVIGYGLVMSAGIDLAYMLFTPDLDEAVNPLIVALSAGSIIILSQDKITENWFAPLALIVMVVSIAVLFWVRKIFIEKKRDELNWP
jgi:hypothetical protein